MYKLALFSILIWMNASILHAQHDVNLFDFWKYYSDVENAQYKTVCKYAFGQLAQRKAKIAELDEKLAYLERQSWVKNKLLELMGPFPEKTPLNPQVTGTINRDDFRVEKLIYESMPGYYVPAALFLPTKTKGKSPAIIYASGHTVNGFRGETYQHVIINLVKKGFIVLAFDPIGQGERLQYYNEEAGKSDFGPTHEHSYPGAQCYLAGYSPTKYFVWDAIRSIDYLLARKEVDPSRIGMTGRSGGGTQTAFTAAIDERIYAAAPECFITSMEYVLKSIGPQDAEQNLIHMLQAGLDHADLMHVRAPKPGLMITTTRDFFSIQGARETYQETQKFYEALDAADKWGMVEDDAGHASTKRNREAMYAFFQKELNLPGDHGDEEVEVFKDEELWATKTGQLATSLGGESIFSLNKQLVQTHLQKLNASRENRRTHIAKLPALVKKLAGIEPPEELDQAIFSGRFDQGHYLLDKYLVQGSGDYMLPVALFKPSKEPVKEIILLLHEKGMADAAKEEVLIDSLIKQQKSVLVCDLPGIGKLGPGYLKGDAYVGQTSLNQWFAGNLTKKSLLGLRVEDILRILAFLNTEMKGTHNITAISYGSLGSEVLHAALLEPAIQQIALIRPFLSFAEIAMTERYDPSFLPSAVAGAIPHYDLPDLMAAMAPRRILIVDPLTASGERFTEPAKAKVMQFPRQVYEDHQGELICKSTSQPSDANEVLLDWLK